MPLTSRSADLLVRKKNYSTNHSALVEAAHRLEVADDDHEPVLELVERDVLGKAAEPAVKQA